jgi:hypothetical protein
MCVGKPEYDIEKMADALMDLLDRIEHLEKLLLEEPDPTLDYPSTTTEGLVFT